MPMRIRPSLISAPTPFPLFRCSRGRGGGRRPGRDEVLYRLPASVRLLLVDGQIGAAAVDRLARRGHRIMAAARGEVTRLRDFDAVRSEVELQILVVDQATQQLAAIDVGGRDRVAG